MKESIVMALAGGALIGVATSLFLILNGRVTGISGIVNGLLERSSTETNWKWFFVIGMFSCGVIVNMVRPELFAVEVNRSSVMMLVAGVLVGFGTVMAKGCTSGHGICGVARLSPRSLVATVAFMASGMFMANFLRWIVGL